MSVLEGKAKYGFWGCPMSKNLLLLGDSIFDNGVYVRPGEEDVTAHLKRKLEPMGWTIDMRAVDGNLVEHIQAQLDTQPVPKPCVFVLSAGGNNALGYLDSIQNTALDHSIASVLMGFNEIRERFRRSYVDAIDAILAHGQPLIVCTIYNPKFPDPNLQMLAETGLSFFNDVIVEEALKRNLPIIDLRDVCSENDAFANPIAPSEIGGDLITESIISKIASQCFL